MEKIHCEIYSRVSGYYRPVANWNLGKQQEFKDRKTFKVENEKTDNANINGPAGNVRATGET